MNLECGITEYRMQSHGRRVSASLGGADCSRMPAACQFNPPFSRRSTGLNLPAALDHLSRPSSGFSSMRS